MARIAREDYHVLQLTHFRGRITVGCACRATVLDRVASEQEAREVFDHHMAEVKGAKTDAEAA